MICGSGKNYHWYEISNSKNLWKKKKYRWIEQQFTFAYN